MTTQHASLSEERWSSFSLDQQVLMIGNEMNRGRKLMASDDWSRLRNCYERVLRLVDLTVQANDRYGLRRELLRWRDVVAELYIAEGPSRLQHDAAFRCLLRFTPVASQQIPHLLPSA
jgi:hypothetical protein